eukprot:scpid67908/ scgid23408/ 
MQYPKAGFACLISLATVGLLCGFRFTSRPALPPTRAPKLDLVQTLDTFGEEIYNTSTVLRGTFAYLVMGRGVINDVWYQISRQPKGKVYVWYLAWEAELSAANDTKYFQTMYFPKSTWASGRNQLLFAMQDRERLQGWLFDYVVFWDDDVRLLLRHNISSVSPRSSHLAAERMLRQLVLRDRPARAGVEFPYRVEDLPMVSMKCVQNCAFDAALDIFHRSVVDQLLPYTTGFDTYNWWMASETSSYRSSAMFAPYCNTYRAVVHDPRANEHWGNYPQGKGFKETAIAFYLSCIARSRVSERTWKRLFTHGLTRVYGDDGEPCLRQLPTVNYYNLITDEGRQIRQCNYNHTGNH